MANVENLVPNENRTPEERRANATKAGIASGKARRAKRDRHERIKYLFELAIKDPKLVKSLAELGIDTTDADLETAADARVLLEVLRKGDYKAWSTMKDEAYGKLSDRTEVELSGEVSGININIKKFDKGK